MSSSIADALAAAKNAAAETPQPTVTNTDVASVAQTAPATLGQSRSLDHFMETAQEGVEAYLGVSHLGIQLGKDLKLHDEILVRMKFGDCKPGWQLRVNAPGGVQYFTTYDGNSEIRTRKNWEALINESKRIDANSYPSDLIELPVELADTYARKENGPVKEGDRVGLSLSYMKLKPFITFLKRYKPVFGNDTEMLVKLTAVAKKGGNQDYGVFAFELIEETPAAAEPAKKK